MDVGPLPPLWAVVVAAGESRRMGSLGPKVWWKAGGRPVLAWALQPLVEAPVAGGVVVAAAGQEARARALLGALGLEQAWRVVTGGRERLDSVERGVRALPPGPPEGLVLVHDAARPLVSVELVRRVARAAHDTGAAVPGLPPVDTVKLVAASGRRVETTLDRRRLLLAQTPQAVRRGILEAALAAYRAAGSPDPLPTDEADLVERSGRAVAWVEGEPRARKLTVPEDRAWLAQWAGPVEIPAAEDGTTAPAAPPKSGWRIGHGYDVHPFAAGRPLVLGGVVVPHPAGLAGDSDADVLVHAVIDAVLGALAWGDLGHWFSPEAARGLSSLRLLEKVWRQVTAAGYRLGNLDATIVAQTPRLAPHVAAMRQTLAAHLGAAVGQVSVKATTPDRLGFIGRQEGVAAEAVVLLRGEDR